MITTGVLVIFSYFRIKIRCLLFEPVLHIWDPISIITVILPQTLIDAGVVHNVVAKLSDRVIL